MEKIDLQLAKIVGTSTKKGWSQVHTFTPTEPEKLTRRGQLLAVISLGELEGEIEAVSVGREVISRLHEEYYGNLVGNPLERLEEAIKKVVAEVKPGAEIEIAATAVIGEILYLAVFGQGRLVLAREGKIATVLTGEGTASGRLQNNDVFFLGTGKIFEIIAEGTLRAALVTDSPEEATETLVPIIHAQEESGTIAGLVAKAKREKSEEAIELEEKKEKVSVKKKLSMGLNLTVFLQTLQQKVRPLLFQLRRKLKVEAVYLKGEGEKKRRSQKTVITVALVLFLLLAVSVVLGTRQRKQLGQGKTTSALLQEAKAKKEEGAALLELNPLKAKELLLEAQNLVREIESEGAAEPAVGEFKQELESLLAKVLREHEVAPGVYFDLELIKAGASGSDLDVSAEQVIILDPSKSTVYGLGVSDKKSAILAGGEELKGANQVAAFLPKIFVLTEKGVIQSEETKKQKLVIEADEAWGKIADLRAFGGSLYLLDQKGEIWKYTGVEEGFGGHQAWLQGEVKPDLNEAVSMAIDGAIWILKSDGAILKYVRGVRDAFGVAGLDKPLTNPTAIYTDADQERLYLLDQGNSRVVVLAKSGEYHSQYLWEGIKDASGLVASEKEGKILLLVGSKVYEIKIK